MGKWSFVVALLGASWLQAQTVLIIGDSHIVGDFGEYFHWELHKLNRYDILSLGIGGAGSLHFTNTLKNHCCGYKFRESCRGEKLVKGQKIRVLEEGKGADGGMILPGFHSQLGELLQAYRPEVVVVALGSNNVNAHGHLLRLIKRHCPAARIAWIGPFLRLVLEQRLRAIQAAIKREPSAILIRSDDILGHDILKSAHFTGAMARKWAAAVVERLKTTL
ncbi:MAG: SGNH/GDSL hydrolase family protein [Flavobacteriales bacterium]|nr:SGNH/GDSL hydrolase family protein [Flavobacteriales bacterium]MDW8409088.1 SGNH/GDSL hydrolase family protein [Flavobacteriales bacterium]